MAWELFATAGVSALSSIFGASSAGNASAVQASAQSKAENEAIARSNIQSMVRNNYKAGMKNLQLGLTKKQLAQQGFDITVQAESVLGAASANQAASGTIGASADAVLTDIQMKAGEAQANLGEQTELSFINFNNELEAMAMGAEQEVLQSRKYEYVGPTAGQMVTSGIMAGVTSFAGNYASQYMKLGLGTPGGGGSGLSMPTQSNLPSMGGGYGLRY